MRLGTKDVMIRLTIDVILIPLMGNGNVASVSLAAIVMNATAIIWATMCLLVLVTILIC